MKKILAAFAIALSLAAQAGNLWVIEVDGGGTFIVRPETARRYTNEFGAQQADAIVEYVRPDGWRSEFIQGVTDCGNRIGSIGRVDPSGNPTGDVYQWRAGGERTLDLLAHRICFAVRELKSLTPSNHKAPHA